MTGDCHQAENGPRPMAAPERCGAAPAAPPPQNNSDPISPLAETPVPPRDPAVPCCLFCGEPIGTHPVKLIAGMRAVVCPNVRLDVAAIRQGAREALHGARFVHHTPSTDGPAVRTEGGQALRGHAGDTRPSPPVALPAREGVHTSAEEDHA